MSIKALYQFVPLAVVWSVLSVCMCAEGVMAAEIDLMSVLRMTLANQTDIKLGELDVERAGGNLQAAGGQFDTTVFGNTYYEKQDSLLTEYEQNLLGYDANKSETTGIELGVRRQFRLGFEGEAAVKSSRVNDQSGLVGYPTTTRNVVEFSLNIPLLRNRGTVITAEERQFELEKQASLKRQQKVVSDAVAASANAYWDYLEMYEALEIKKTIEARTARFLENTKRLIELGERPPADAVQIGAQLASKRSERIEAERGLFEARQRLGIAMGIQLSELSTFEVPATSFPVIKEMMCTDLLKDGQLFEEGLVNRGDYQAVQLEEKALGTGLEKDLDSLKPRLDLKLSANYEGVNEDSGYADFSAEDSSGPGGLVMLNGEWPILNNSAKGIVATNQAQLRQAHLRTVELERNIRSNINVALMDVCRLASATTNLHEAVELYNEAVTNEASRLTRGLTTLVNLITIEDKRNSAQEDLIVQQSALAKALVRLRNESGILVQVDEEKGVLDIDSLTALPGI